MPRDTDQERALCRRDFCVSVGHAAIALAPLILGCEGKGPTEPSPPAGTTLPPTNPQPPPENPPPAVDPTPPPTSAIVTTLPIVAGTLVQGVVLAVTIDASSPLATPWTGALAQIMAGGIQRNLLLMRTGAETFTALNGVCTHEGCTVSRTASPIFVCPCHGSRYDHNGQVVQGPAPAALPRLQAQYADGVLTVRL